MESSRRGLLNDVAEHRPILKNGQYTYYHRFGSTPKIGIEFPKTGDWFLLGVSYWPHRVLFLITNGRTFSMMSGERVYDS